MGCLQSKTEKSCKVEEAEEAEMVAEVLTLCESGVADVPGSNLQLHYCAVSLDGYDSQKPNQDSFCIHPQLGGNPNDHLFGVFDGHGTFGGECSHFVKQNISHNLAKAQDMGSDTVNAHYRAFDMTNQQLHANPKIDDFMCGTTAITVLVRGDKLHVANVGDSRAILGERRGKRIVAVELSNDQTPYREDELQRVLRHGGIVRTSRQLEGGREPNVRCWGGRDDDGRDPPRVWVWAPSVGEYEVGSMFTRSMGDKYVETYAGVIAEPEVNVVQLTPNHPFFVVVSDGVTTFLSSQEIVDIIAKYEDVQLACSAIVSRSYSLWLENEGYSDDMTVILVQIKGLKDVPKGKPSTHSKGARTWRKLCKSTKVGSFHDLE